MDIYELNVKDYEALKDRISLRVVQPKTTKLMERPHMMLQDLAVVYDVELEREGSMRKALVINNTLLSQWGISLEKLHEQALCATAQRSPYALMPINMVFTEQDVNLLAKEAYSPDPFMPLLVATNADKQFGASVLAYPQVMERIGHVVADDYYILPSSVHEVLILPKQAAMQIQLDVKAMREMVQSVNATGVMPHEQLSNKVYEYNRDSKSLSIAKEKTEKDRGTQR